MPRFFALYTAPSKLLTTWPLLWMILLATLAGCRKTGGDLLPPPVRKETDPRVLHRNTNEPEHLDPALIAETGGGQIASDLFEGLYAHGRDHNTWVPGVALRHEVSEDGLQWTFYLREEARWSDGEPLYAQDFVYAWRRTLEPATGSRMAALLWVIDGAQECNAGQRPCGDIGVEALDNHTLKVHLVAPFPGFAQLTAGANFAPVPRHRIEAGDTEWHKPGTAVSNGPWVLQRWVHHQMIELAANPHYHTPTQQPFDKIFYHLIEDMDPAHSLFLSGELDLLEGAIPGAALVRYRLEQHPSLESAPYLGVYYYKLNVRRPPLNDVRVRRALALSIYREAFGPYVVRGGQIGAHTLVPPQMKDFGYPGPSTQLDVDLNEAKRLLAEAGYENGRGLPPLKLSYNTSEGHRMIAEFVQQLWKSQLGIDLRLENMEWKVLLAQHEAGEYEITRSAWIGDYIDPMTFLELFEGDNPQNSTGWKNEAYDRLLRLARAAPDQQTRFEHLARAEEIFLEELPGIPLYFYVKHDLVQPWLKGHGHHLQGMRASRWYWIDPGAKRP